MELAQSKRRRAHTNTCELQTSSTLDTRPAVRLLDVLVVVSGVILVGTSCDLGGGLGGGLLWQVELQVRASGLSCEGQEGKCELCCQFLWRRRLAAAASCSQSPLLRNHQTHRIHNSSYSCYSFGTLDMDVMMLARVMVSSGGTSFQQIDCLLQSLQPL